MLVKFSPSGMIHSETGGCPGVAGIVLRAIASGKRNDESARPSSGAHSGCRIKNGGAVQASSLVDALKRMLKGQGLTYADLAAALDLSEASIKRMFSRRDFTLQRLEDICRMAGIDFADLARAAADANVGVSQLTVEQEQEIVSDPKLLLVALCAMNNWTLEQIVATYQLSQAECIRCLLRLDRRHIIELLPGNRIRPLISRTFSWRPDGPIQRYFRSRIEAEYLSSKFDGAGELFVFVSGMLSRTSTTALIAQLRRVAREFAERHRDDLSLPFAQRFGTSLLVAMRPWEPRAFHQLRRADAPPAPAGRLLQLDDGGRGKSGRGTRDA
jgi:transcriptional regulator with XRE-family HTH domain